MRVIGASLRPDEPTPNVPAVTDEQTRSVAPRWMELSALLAECADRDEVREYRDKALAMQVYYRQAKDRDNEAKASRIRVRAERRYGELLIELKDSGGRATVGGDRLPTSQAATMLPPTLAELGITRSEASRAEALARVPEPQFEAALAVESPVSPAAVRKLAPKRGGPVECAAPKVDARPVVATWNAIRDLRLRIEDGRYLDPDGWTHRPGIQAFQVEEIREALPIIVEYLTRLELEG